MRSRGGLHSPALGRGNSSGCTWGSDKNTELKAERANFHFPLLAAANSPQGFLETQRSGRGNRGFPWLSVWPRAWKSQNESLTLIPMSFPSSCGRRGEDFPIKGLSSQKNFQPLEEMMRHRGNHPSKSSWDIGDAQEEQDDLYSNSASWQLLQLSPESIPLFPQWRFGVFSTRTNLKTNPIPAAHNLLIPKYFQPGSQEWRSWDGSPHPERGSFSTLPKSSF